MAGRPSVVPSPPRRLRPSPNDRQQTSGPRCGRPRAAGDAYWSVARAWLSSPGSSSAPAIPPSRSPPRSGHLYAGQWSLASTFDLNLSFFVNFVVPFKPILCKENIVHMLPKCFTAETPLNSFLTTKFSPPAKRRGRLHISVAVCLCV